MFFRQLFEKKSIGFLCTKTIQARSKKYHQSKSNMIYGNFKFNHWNNWTYFLDNENVWFYGESVL